MTQILIDHGVNLNTVNRSGVYNVLIINRTKNRFYPQINLSYYVNSNRKRFVIIWLGNSTTYSSTKWQNKYCTVITRQWC